MFERKPTSVKAQTGTNSVDSDSLYFPVLGASEILATVKRKQSLKPLLELSSLDNVEYTQLCQPVIDKLAEFYQELPYSDEGIYSDQGGLLDFALERAYQTMSMSRSYFLPTGSELIMLTLPQQLWAYAVLTASLLQDIGHVALQFQVSLFDKEKRALGVWHPFVGAMTKQGNYYRYAFLGDKSDEVKRQTTVLLARHFMPVKGFEWIASNSQVFDMWLALLQGDSIRAGTFGPVFLRAEAMVIQKYLSSFANANYNAEIGKGLLSDLFSKSDADKNVSAKHKQEALARYVDAFLHWLKENIREEKMRLGEGHLKVVNKGLLLTDDIFKEFSKQKGGKYDWKTIKEAIQKSHLASTDKSSYIQATDSARQVANLSKSKVVILNNLFLTLPAAMSPLVLKWLPQLQEFGYVKMPTGLSEQNYMKYVSPGGELVNKSKPLLGTFAKPSGENVATQDHLQPGRTTT